jgi:hypothetical protein
LPNISTSELVFYWGIAKLVRQRVLIPSSVGSSPATPAISLPISFKNHDISIKK